ncbi:hypothetical protein NQ317_011387 [Molorchus minor]|uniref:Uncharacterized protein n=1 Tax=Molorchus minor TaxID=1323400 RepID=A0ABQ9JT35_9CUCU|nr:hypothetical protein NQ317_011387 [Molorchus minor]
MINIQKLFRLQSSKLKKSIYFSTITICNNVKRCSVTSSKSYKLLKCSNNLYVKNNAITLYSTTSSTEAQADFNVFDKACDETLESLTEFFEELR